MPQGDSGAAVTRKPLRSKILINLSRVTFKVFVRTVSGGLAWQVSSSLTPSSGPKRWVQRFTSHGGKENLKASSSVLEGGTEKSSLFLRRSRKFLGRRRAENF